MILSRIFLNTNLLREVNMEHISDSNYLLETYDETIQRINSSARIAEEVYHKANNTDPLTAATLRAAANAIWKHNLNDYQRIFMQRGSNNA